MSDDVQVLSKGRFARFVRESGWEYVQRTQVTGIVIIVPVTDEGCAVLVEQFRIPMGTNVIEWPAGLAGDIPGSEDEPLLEAARRELLEETGFIANKFTMLTQGPPSPGLSDEIVCFYLAQGLTRTEDGGGDESEDIQVHLVPLTNMEQWLSEKQANGALIDPKIFSGLYFINRQGQ